MDGSIAIIGAPSSAGAYAPGQERAPAALREAGLIGALKRQGGEIQDRGDLPAFRWCVDHDSPRARNTGAVVAMIDSVRDEASTALAEGSAVLVLGGDCSAVVSIATSMLSEIAGAFVFVGIPLIAAAWFAGPARLAVRMRRAITPFLRDHPEATFGIVAGILVLIFLWNPIPATSRSAGIIVFTVLAMFSTVVLRQQTAREFSDSP